MEPAQEPPHLAQDHLSRETEREGRRREKEGRGGGEEVLVVVVHVTHSCLGLQYLLQQRKTVTVGEVWEEVRQLITRDSRCSLTQLSSQSQSVL